MQTLSKEEFEKKYGKQALKQIQSVSPLVEKKTGVGERVSGTIKGAGEGVYGAITGTGEYAGQSPIRRGFEATAQAFNAVPKVALDVMPEPVRKTVGKVGEVVSKGFSAITNKIGDIPQLQKWTQENPEAANRLEEILGTTSAAGQISGDILLAQQGAKGLQKGAEATKIVAQKGAEQTGKLLQAGKNKVVKITANSPEQIMQRVARISKDKQAKFKDLAGESVGEYLTNRKIFGNIEDISKKLYDRFSKSKQTADVELAKLPGKYDPAPVKTALRDLLKRELEVSSKDAPSMILDEVKRLSKKDSWTMTEINQIKRLYEANVKVDYLKTMNPKGVARATNIDSAIRNWQFKQAKTLGLKNLPEINRETQLARSLLNALGKEYSGSAGNNAVSLTDWIVLSGGDPTAIAGFIAKKGFSSKSVQSAVAKLLSKGKKSIGEVTGDVGPSEVLQLPSPTTGFRSVVGSGKKIRVAPKGRNIEIID